MGEDPTPFWTEFNGSLRIESRAERLTSEAGAVILREVVERLGVVPWMVERLRDPRDPPYLVRPVGRPPKEPRTWFHETSYQAESWSRPRRVVLAVMERQGELFLHHFWLITNWSREQMPAAELLGLYRERGTAEGYYGELKSVLDPALSSSPRQKSHYRGEVPQKRTVSGDAFAQNEVILLLNALAYNVSHAARVPMEAASGEGWSLMRLRERVLRVAARVLVHGRRATLVIGKASAALWHALWSQLIVWRYVET